MKTKKIAGAAAMAIVLAGGSFYAGVSYQKKKLPNRITLSNMQGFGERGQMSIQNGNMRFRAGSTGGFSGGEILSKDEKSITIKMPDGSSKLVFLSDSTTVGKTATGTKEDLKIGEQVMVTGSAGNDGSITAQSIQIRPDMLMELKK